MNADTTSTATARGDQPARAKAEPWRRRFTQSLLYGRNVDRDKKAKARLGLAILAFSLVYLIIAARLLLYGIAPESHVARRAVNSDAVATARPDILDRNGNVLATDVLTPSLFAEPRRIIDADEASELLVAVMPDLANSDYRERLEGRPHLVGALGQPVDPRRINRVVRIVGIVVGHRDHGDNFTGAHV